MILPDMPAKPVILAVDDTPENLDVVKGILASSYTVKAAINGSMALKIAEKQAPDLILLDIMMPDMNGYEVCQRLKSNPATKDIPVIFLTAMDQTTDEASGFELGAADYITKPVNPPILKARVKTHLALKQSMDELQNAYGIIKLQKDRMEEELNIGRDIQMSMLPLEFPAFPEREEFSIHALLEPAREVGGDFYDFFFINEDEICLVVGDVSGKGVPAALFMAVTKTMIKTRAMDDPSPSSIVTSVNDEMSEDNPSCMFVTLFIAICNVRTGKFRYTNAGHNPPYVKRKDGHLECLDERHGPIIGAVEGLAYRESHIELAEGDAFLVFTDGVTEAMDPDGQLYSDNRLERLLDQLSYKTARDLAEKALASVEEFAASAEQADDITIMAFSLDAMPEQSARKQIEITVEPRLAEIERVYEEFNQFAERSGVPPDCIKRVKIALDELLNNIISYGLEEGDNRPIEVRFEYTGSRLLTEIIDQGIPFNPFDRAQPDTSLSIEERELGGLGTLLVSRLMDEVSYDRRKDLNIVRLISYMND
jgi:sigma-B regulation protein RsbU (phosphoserine phosphatase)